MGAEYVGIAERLKLHASEGLAHTLEVARQIDDLGGDPTVKVKDAEYYQDSKRMLVIGLEQEQVTIKHYRENPSSGTLWRICTFGSINGYYRTGTRSRNRSERRHRLTMVIDELSISQCQNRVRADNCSCC